MGGDIHRSAAIELEFWKKLTLDTIDQVFARALDGDDGSAVGVDVDSIPP